MIEQHQPKTRRWIRRWWQGAFAVLLTATVVVSAAPEASANALYLLTDGITTVVTGAERVDDSRILLTGAAGAETDVVLESGKKVTIRHDEIEQYATSRSGERVSALLQREGVSVGPLEMVRVDLSKDAVTLEIAADFTYYETVSEEAAYRTVQKTDYTLPKGETRVERAGANGHQDVTYEVVYADGMLVSRQAVSVAASNAVDEIVRVGTLVKEAREGDTIDSVITNDDGSGYLLLASGDALHFTGTMEVRCTAYTAGVAGVGTRTYTGTEVHVGVVAVDKNVIPLGSTMFIASSDGRYTYGMAHAEDTGVRGKSVDLYMNSLAECKQFGLRSGMVYFLDE